MGQSSLLNASGWVGFFKEVYMALNQFWQYLFKNTWGQPAFSRGRYMGELLGAAYHPP